MEIFQPGKWTFPKGKYPPKFSGKVPKKVLGKPLFLPEHCTPLHSAYMTAAQRPSAGPSNHERGDLLPAHPLCARLLCRAWWDESRQPAATSGTQPRLPK